PSARPQRACYSLHAQESHSTRPRDPRRQRLVREGLGILAHVRDTHTSARPQIPATRPYVQCPTRLPAIRASRQRPVHAASARAHRLRIARRPHLLAVRARRAHPLHPTSRPVCHSTVIRLTCRLESTKGQTYLPIRLWCSDKLHQRYSTSSQRFCYFPYKYLPPSSSPTFCRKNSRTLPYSSSSNYSTINSSALVTFRPSSRIFRTSSIKPSCVSFLYSTFTMKCLFAFCLCKCSIFLGSASKVHKGFSCVFGILLRLLDIPVYRTSPVHSLIIAPSVEPVNLARSVAKLVVLNPFCYAPAAEIDGVREYNGFPSDWELVAPTISDDFKHPPRGCFTFFVDQIMFSKDAYCLGHHVGVSFLDDIFSNITDWKKKHFFIRPAPSQYPFTNEWLTSKVKQRKLPHSSQFAGMLEELNKNVWSAHRLTKHSSLLNHVGICVDKSVPRISDPCKLSVILVYISTFYTRLNIYLFLFGWWWSWIRLILSFFFTLYIHKLYIFLPRFIFPLMLFSVSNLHVSFHILSNLETGPVELHASLIRLYISVFFFSKP
ncbi:Unknown protein, partial [Striga hermonthica]